MIKRFIKILLSDNDSISSTRLIGIISLFVFFIVIFISIKNNIQPELLKISLEYLFYIISVSLFSKTLKDIFKLIKIRKESNR